MKNILFTIMILIFGLIIGTIFIIFNYCPKIIKNFIVMILSLIIFLLAIIIIGIVQICYWLYKIL